MTGQLSQIAEFIDLVERMRSAQMEFFLAKQGQVIGLTKAQIEQRLVKAIKLEAECDQFIALYRADVARMRNWAAGAIEMGCQSDLESLDRSEPVKQPNIADWLQQG